MALTALLEPFVQLLMPVQLANYKQAHKEVAEHLHNAECSTVVQKRCKGSAQL